MAVDRHLADAGPWEVAEGPRAAPLGRSAAGLDRSVGVVDRITVAVVAAGCGRPVAPRSRRPGAATGSAAGSSPCSSTTSPAAPARRAPVGDRSIAGPWLRLSPLPPRRVGGRRSTPRSVLVADHELAASTLAARVAAAFGADPYAVVGARGWARQSGHLHAGGVGPRCTRCWTTAACGAPRPPWASAWRSGRAPPRLRHAAVPRRRSPGPGAAPACSTPRRRRRPPAGGHRRLVAGGRSRPPGPQRRLRPRCPRLRDGDGARRCPGPRSWSARMAGWLAHAMEEYGARTPSGPGPPTSACVRSRWDRDHRAELRRSAGPDRTGPGPGVRPPRSDGSGAAGCSGAPARSSARAGVDPGARGARQRRRTRGCSSSRSAGTGRYLWAGSMRRYSVQKRPTV